MQTSRVGQIASSCALFVLLSSDPAAAQDTDGDGALDSVDNCITTSNGPIPQCDTDGDGYGNQCDADYDQSQSTDGGDFGEFSKSFQSGEPHPSGTDMNCDGTIDGTDYSMFKPLFTSGAPPGPSALPCAGAQPCPSPSDTDGDGVFDDQDNCTEVANPTQCDTDVPADGYGNACDADFDGSEDVSSTDYVSFFSPDFQAGFETPGRGTNLDCDPENRVNEIDRDLFLAAYSSASAPGPSGLHPPESDPNADADGDGRLDSEEDSDGDGYWDDGETHLHDADSDNDFLCDGTKRMAWKADGTLICAGSEFWEDRQPLVADAEGVNDQIPCPNCFAVVVVPDTQYYTAADRQTVNAAGHLNQVMDYICQQQSSWREPATKKVMPIRMMIQLGDLVHDASESGAPQEWQRIDAAFDRLDACSQGVVPYLAVPGNHDREANKWSLQSYSLNFAAPCDAADPTLACNNTAPFNTSEAMVRQGWLDHLCADPANCSWPQEWFADNGDDVEAFSRGPMSSPGLGEGPPIDQPGRQRAVVIRAPNGKRFLFIGLDHTFEFGPTETEPWLSDDISWVKDMLAAYSDAAAMLIHHQAFAGGGGGFPGGSAGARSWNDMWPDAWSRLVEPQVFMTLNGHWDVAYAGNGVTDDVYRLFRNFQGVSSPAPNPKVYGYGWQVILVFDPDAGEIRARSYRISDIEEYRTQWMYDYIDPDDLPPGFTVNRNHTSPLVNTQFLDTDYACSAPGSPLYPGDPRGTSPAACPHVLPWNID